MASSLANIAHDNKSLSSPEKRQIHLNQMQSSLSPFK